VNEACPGADASHPGGCRNGTRLTAGIGEHSPQVRQRVCDGLAWLGVELDPSANLEGRPALHTSASRVEVLCLPTDEEAVIARHTAELLSN
jgi:acetate kinase